MEQVFGAIPSVLKGLETNADIDEAVVFAAWTKCAGELLRARTAPLEFSDKRLVIAVQDNTWKRHLEDLSPQVLGNMNTSLGHGTVRFIEFRIAPASVTSDRDTDSTAKAETEKPTAAPSLTAAAAAITDEHLREQFLEAAAIYLARQSS